ncbi:MAG: hypothetical protein ACE5GE_15940 [Phycisphaerae bacterium]
MAKLQLARILQQLADAHGGHVALSNDIKSVDKRGPHPKTVRKICEGANYRLSEGNLQAIHRFLCRENQPGLDAVRIFEPEGLLWSLVEKEHVTFYLPPMVQPVPEGDGGYREYLSSWDFRAFCSISDSINDLGAHVHVDFQSEPPCPPDTPLGTIEWAKLLDADDRAYCAVGSPLVSGLSGYMLGKMFNVDDPFSPASPMGPRLPFFFSWYPKDKASARGPYPNAFALSPEYLATASEDLRQAIREKRAQAFCVDNEVLEVWLEREPHDQYGVVVAQRREGGAIWSVVAGLSGPSTFACAEALPQIKRALPDCREDEVSEVLYAVVKSVVGKDAARQFGDTRKPGPPDLVATPKLWSARGGKWR